MLIESGVVFVQAFEHRRPIIYLNYVGVCAMKRRIKPHESCCWYTPRYFCLKFHKFC
jgi:hypothetical protein